MNAPQSICNFCIMDTTDPDIQFFGDDGCNHCIHARSRLAHDRFPGPAGEERLKSVVAHIKKAGAGKRYDCVVGLSGGVDSSYVLLRAVQLGLRPLAVHVDNSWNSELAVDNIRKIIQKLGVDLVTIVIDWEEIRELQRACFNVPIVDIEIVSDHAIFAGVYKTAAEHNVKFILSGTNVATESILPDAWAYDKRDRKHVMSIYKTYGQGKKLKTYPSLGPLKFLYYTLVKGIKFVPILNYGDYNKAQTVALLKETFDWRAYPNKHGESAFTRFFQDYYLPAKFGFDKRKAHLSSIIASGGMTREEALAEMNKPLFRPEDLAAEKDFVLKKLGYSEAQWQSILQKPATQHKDLPNNAWMFDHKKNPVTRALRKFAKFESKDN